MTEIIEVILTKQAWPEIELQTPLGEVDLHNFACFNRLEYETDGRLHLEWLSSKKDEFKLGERAINRAELLFEQVSRFTLTPRDPEMPRSEDRTLEDFEVEEVGIERCHLRFTFHGGIVIDVIASRISLIVEYEAVE